MFCSHCGAQIKDGVKFCSRCGSPVNSGYSSQNTQYDPYGQNPYYQATGVPIKRRELAVSIVLSIITLGIYGIYWFICVINDLNTACNQNDDMSGETIFLLTFITFGIFGIYWAYKAGEKINYVREMRGVQADISMSIVFLILAIFGLQIVNVALIQNELNEVASF